VNEVTREDLNILRLHFGKSEGFILAVPDRGSIELGDKML